MTIEEINKNRRSRIYKILELNDATNKASWWNIADEIEQFWNKEIKKLVKGLRMEERDHLSIDPVEGERGEERCSICSGLISEDSEYDTCGCCEFNQAVKEFNKKLDDIRGKG